MFFLAPVSLGPHLGSLWRCPNFHCHGDSDGRGTDGKGGLTGRGLTGLLLLDCLETRSQPKPEAGLQRLPPDMHGKGRVLEGLARAGKVGNHIVSDSGASWLPCPSPVIPSALSLLAALQITRRPLYPALHCSPTGATERTSHSGTQRAEQEGRNFSSSTWLKGSSPSPQSLIPSGRSLGPARPGHCDQDSMGPSAQGNTLIRQR